MSDKVTDAISTLMRVVPTRFSGEVAVVKAEIERLKEVAAEILVDYDMSERRHIGMHANYYEEIASHRTYIDDYLKRIKGESGDGNDI